VSQVPFGPHFGFGVYVHWPYCAKVCPYCDFNVYAAKDRPTDDLASAIAADIRSHRARLPDHGAVDTIYFGGGTPALMRADQISLILLAIAETFGVKAGAEITLEANPNDLARLDLPRLAACGVNRLSIGVQSLRDDVLSFLGRDHDAAAARTAVARALVVFPNTSIDLIYARPGQTLADWQDELSQALGLGAPHLALYELTIEPGTAFGKALARGELVPLDDDRQAELYELTDAITRGAGLPAYEVSNHARGLAFQSRHNLAYWNGADWLGVGPGAHGRVTVGAARYAVTTARQPGAYQQAVAEAGSGWDEGTQLAPVDIARELIAMGLRPAIGIDVARIEAVSKTEIARDKIAAFVAEGWMAFDGKRLWLTAQGRLLADALTLELSP
jgi:putative oxygen-independent coproporphyrinogen III oxidase